MFTNIFISSNQKEFLEERWIIKEEIESDYFLSKIFKVFIFENTPASGKTSQETYLDEIEKTDIYIGLIGSEYGTILDSGISPTEEEYDRYNEIGDNCFVFIKNVDKRDDKTTNFINKIKRNNTYKRFDNTDELIDEIKRSLAEYMTSRLKNIPFDHRVLENTSINDIDNESIDLFFNLLNIGSPMKKLKDTLSIENILIQLHAAIKDRTGFHLTNTGLLFFAKDISKYNLSHQITMVRFSGITRNKILDKKESKSSIFKLLNEIEIFFDKNTRKEISVNGFRSTTIPEYPYEAIREAIVNAIAHREYDYDNSFITFYIYDDRIEVISPGRLMYPLTIENLEKENPPAHRNKYIADILSKTEYMEHVGRGISRMKSSMLEYALPSPIFEENNNFFKVTLYNSTNSNPNNKHRNNQHKTSILENIKLNNRQKQLLIDLSENEKITYDDYEKKFEVSHSTAVRDLNTLVKNKIMIKTKINLKVYFELIKEI
ncbi:MAG: DUF4062 domain-containing protein [Methanosphaera sp.]|nr:DUF4062 domain-containing protein [Methanosphaera sp.]